MPGLMATDFNTHHTFNGLGNTLQVHQQQQGNTVGRNQVHPAGNVSGPFLFNSKSGSESSPNYRNLDDVFVVSPVKVEPVDHGSEAKTNEMLIMDPNALEVGQIRQVHRNMTVNEVPARKDFKNSNYSTK